MLGVIPFQFIEERLHNFLQPLHEDDIITTASNEHHSNQEVVLHVLDLQSIRDKEILSVIDEFALHFMNHDNHTKYTSAQV
jgi:hypothetical protein